MAKQFRKLSRSSTTSEIFCIGTHYACESAEQGGQSKIETLADYAVFHLGKYGHSLYQDKVFLGSGRIDVFHFLDDIARVKTNAIIVVDDLAKLIVGSDFTSLYEQQRIRLNVLNTKDACQAWDTRENLCQALFIMNPTTRLALIKIGREQRQVRLMDIRNLGFKGMVDLSEFLQECGMRLYYDGARTQGETNGAADNAWQISVIAERWSAMNDRWRLGGLRSSLGSQSMAIFRKECNVNEIKPHEDIQAKNIERDALLPGRWECLGNGVVDNASYLLDVASMYPAIVSTTPLPCSLSRIVENPHIADSMFLDPQSDFIAQCRIKTPVNAFPYRRKGNVSYPAGTFTTWLSGAEFRYAYDNGFIEDVYCAAQYATSMTGKTYADFMLTVRKHYRDRGDKISERLAKLTTNTLWGKMLQEYGIWEIAPSIPAPFDWGSYKYTEDVAGNWHQCRAINGEVYKHTEILWSDNVFPAFTVCLIAAGRQLIWRYMMQAGLANVLYVGVDSLIVNEAGYRALANDVDNSGNAPGKLRLQANGDYCVIHSLGNYEIGKVRRIHGEPRRFDEQVQGFWRSSGSSFSPIATTAYDIPCVKTHKQKSNASSNAEHEGAGAFHRFPIPSVSENPRKPGELFSE